MDTAKLCAEWLREQMYKNRLRGIDMVEFFARRGYSVTPSYISNMRRSGMTVHKAKEIADIMGWEPPSFALGAGEVQLGAPEKESSANLTDDSPTHLVISSLQPSAGNGSDQTYEVLDQVKVYLPWLHATYPHLANLTKLALCHIKGDSMEPTFTEEDTLLVDTSTVSFESDGVYVFSYHDNLLVKRIQRRPGQGFMVISDNRDLYDDYLLPNHDLENVRVLAKVVGKFGFERI